MHKVRLLLLLGIALGLSASSMAQGKDDTPFVKNQGQNSSKHDKAKSKDNDSHRKHWWSPPHFGHKKNDSSAHKTAAGSSTKTAASKPMNKSTASTSSGNRAASATKPGQKTVAKAGANSSQKTMAHTSHHKKTVRHDCSPEEAKKGGCQADKHSQKGTTSAS